MGEFSDKATQSEIEQLEGAINSAADQANQGNGAHSKIRELLNRLHIGGAEELDSQATALENKSKAKASEGQHGQAWGLNNNGDEIRAQIYPFLEWHDKIMSAINEAIESIPGLTVIVEKLSEAVSIFVFSLMAPFLMPIIQQVKVELSTGSSEVIGSSKNLQFIVFTDHQSSNPTHSMLSKDHFTNRYLFLNPEEVSVFSPLADKVPVLMSPPERSRARSLNLLSQCSWLLGTTRMMISNTPSMRSLACSITLPSLTEVMVVVVLRVGKKCSMLLGNGGERKTRAKGSS